MKKERTIKLRALITGGSQRIGRAIALRLAKEGLSLVITYRHSKKEAEELLEELKTYPIESEIQHCDLASLDSCDQLINNVKQIDILINNASEYHSPSLKDLASQRDIFEAAWSAQESVHLRAPFYLSMHFGLRMKEKGFGRIINITDRIVHQGKALKGKALYTATKYGLYGITQSLARELAPEVTVNSVAPGTTLPSPTESGLYYENLRKVLPLQELCHIDDITADVMHLIKSRSKTGTVIITDAGSSLTATTPEHL